MIVVPAESVMLTSPAALQMIAPTLAVEQLYERHGYVAVERIYQRRLEGSTDAVAS